MKKLVEPSVGKVSVPAIRCKQARCHTQDQYRSRTLRIFILQENRSRCRDFGVSAKGKTPIRPTLTPVGENPEEYGKETSSFGSVIVFRKPSLSLTKCEKCPTYACFIRICLIMLLNGRSQGVLHLNLCRKVRHSPRVL